MSEKIETVTINGEEYAKKTGMAFAAAETDHIIVIAQRGWIFEGHRDRGAEGRIRLLGASVVRSWSNGRGIGGLAKEAHREEYTLDWAGTVEFAPEGVIATIQCEY
jgi:hypothetical protein